MDSKIPENLSAEIARNDTKRELKRDYCWALGYYIADFEGQDVLDLGSGPEQVAAIELRKKCSKIFVVAYDYALGVPVNIPEICLTQNGVNFQSLFKRLHKAGWFSYSGKKRCCSRIF